MRFDFIPLRGDIRPEVTVAGEVLSLDDERHDFSGLAEGESTQAVSLWIVGPVQRIGGQVIVPLILPHGFDAPEQTRFAQPLVIYKDGPVALPPANAPAPAPDAAFEAAETAAISGASGSAT